MEIIYCCCVQLGDLSCGDNMLHTVGEEILLFYSRRLVLILYRIYNGKDEIIKEEFGKVKVYSISIV